MGKEVKIGLLVIFVLLGVFGYALYSRLKSGAADAAATVADSSDAKPEEKKEPESATAKLSSGPAKLSSGPAKLSSGPAKPSSPPKMLSTDTASSATPTDTGSALSKAATVMDRYSRPLASDASGAAATSDAAAAPLADIPARASARLRDANDRYGRYGESVKSSIDQAVDGAATALDKAASDLAADPFGNRSAGADANPTAALMQNVQNSAEQVVDQAKGAIDQATSTSLDEAGQRISSAASNAFDQAGAALRDATKTDLEAAGAKLNQRAANALEQAGAAIDRTANDVAEATTDPENPLRSTLDTTKNAFDSVRRDVEGAAADLSAPRSPRSRSYDFYGDAQAGKSDTASSAPVTSDRYSAAATSGPATNESSAQFRTQPAAGDRYGLGQSAATTATAPPATTPLTETPAATPAATAGPAATAPSTAAYDRYSTPPRTSSTPDNWSSVPPRTGAAAGARDSRADVAPPAAAIASPAPATPRNPRYALPSQTLPSQTLPSQTPPSQTLPRTAADSAPVASPSAASASPTPPRAFSSSSPAPLRSAPQVAANPSGKTYTVQPNDNYWVISEKVYGSGNYFKALEHHNRERYPRGDLLRTGDVIDTPTAEALTTAYPSLTPKASHLPPPARGTNILSSQRGGQRVYVVEEGDTLFDIARYELGRATRWAEIYQLNKDQIGPDFNHLRAGMQLALPDDPASDTFTRRSDNGIQR